MVLNFTEDLDVITQYYSIVCNEFKRRHGVIYNQESLIERYIERKSGISIVVAMKNGVVGGFELHNRSLKTLPCECYFEDLSNYLPVEIINQNNICEISKMALNQSSLNIDVFNSISSLAGNLCIELNYRALVIFSPRAQALLYKRSFKSIKYIHNLIIQSKKSSFKPMGVSKEFYLTVIYKT